MRAGTTVLLSALFVASCRENGTTSPQAAPSIASHAPSPDAPMLSLLFVGNSYTYVNDLPHVLRDYLQASGRVREVDVASVTVGGATLEGHVRSGDAVRSFSTGHVSHVILQGQSVEPCERPDAFVAAGETLAKAAGAAGAKVVLYETWPRRSDQVDVFREAWSGGSPRAMQSCLLAGYAKLGASLHAPVADVGDAWLRALDSNRELALYQGDGSHPTISGTYLAAVVLAETILDARLDDDAQHPTSLTDAEAAQLRAMAHAP